MSVGMALREVRKTAGLSTAELSKRTRIPESVIEDLERDNFNTCGGPAYARGHIRNIARICGVDAESILAQFESQTIPLNKSIRELLMLKMKLFSQQHHVQLMQFLRLSKW